MSNQDDAEIRLMGLILAQSLFVGIAIGIFHAGLWLVLDDTLMNGFTYGMAAFAIQGLGYYIFKMFFQQTMDERVRIGSLERDRHIRYRHMQEEFDKRRQDLELRMQEGQFHQELNWMERNPGQTPPWVANVPSNSTTHFNPSNDSSLPLGVNFNEYSKEETKNEKKEGENSGED